MKRRLIAVFAGLILTVSGTLFSQTSSVAYYLNIPQSHFLNPALKPSNRFYIGLPGISGVNVSIGENFLTLTDIFIPGVKSDSIFSFQNPNFDLKNLVSKMPSKSNIMAEGNVQLLGLGFPVGKNFSVTIDVNDRFTSKILFPKSFLDLYFAGAADLVGKTVNITDLNVQGMYFREYGVGFSGEVIPNLRIGARFKVLSGITSISFDNKAFSLTINNDLSQAVSANATMQMAGYDDVNKVFSQGNVAKNYFTMPLNNPGYGLDFGAEYSLGRILHFSLAVKDLGSITWKNNLQAWKANSSFTLPGVTLQDVQNQSVSVDDMFSNLVDSIKANFREVTTPSTFKTALPTQIIAGASFTPIKLISIGVLSVSKMYGGSMNEALTLSANLHLGQAFSATAAYTMANRTYDNLGFGLAVKAGAAQIYLIADKIPVAWDKIYMKKSGSSDYKAIPLPKNFNTVTLQFGVNIVFGKTAERKHDKPSVQPAETKNQVEEQQQQQ
jgi:hypothetical protein